MKKKIHDCLFDTHNFSSLREALNLFRPRELKYSSDGSVRLIIKTENVGNKFFKINSIVLCHERVRVAA